MSESSVLGVVGAGSNESMQFAEPRHNCAIIEKYVANGTLASVGAVSVRSVSVTMKAMHRTCTGIVTQSNIASAFEIAQQVLESLPVSGPRVGHKLAQLVHGERNVRTSPVCNKICECHQRAILGAISRIRFVGTVLHTIPG